MSEWVKCECGRKWVKSGEKCDLCMPPEPEVIEEESGDTEFAIDRCEVEPPKAKEARSIWDSVLPKLEEMARHYRVRTGVPFHVLDALLNLANTPRGKLEFYDRMRSVMQKMQIHCLAAWASGRAEGPDDASAASKKAKNAENLARMFEKRGDDERARYHQERADRFRESAVQRVEVHAPLEDTTGAEQVYPPLVKVAATSGVRHGKRATVERARRR